MKISLSAFEKVYERKNDAVNIIADFFKNRNIDDSVQILSITIHDSKKFRRFSINVLINCKAAIEKYLGKEIHPNAMMVNFISSNKKCIDIVTDNF